MNWRHLLVGLLAFSLLASAGALALNQSADKTPNPRITSQVTKSEHKMGDWGAMDYQANDGSMATLPGEINQSVDLPVAYKATDVNFSAADEFPRSTDADHATESQLWTKDASGSAGTGTVSNTTTATGVDAVQMSTSSQTSSDTMSFTYSDFTVSSDENSRYLQIALDVNTLDSGATVNVSVVDSDGDERRAILATGENYADANVIGNSTGEGLVYQEELGQIPLEGSGSGTWNDIEKVRVDVHDANADVEISALNLERQSPWTWGENETSQITNHGEGGYINITSLGTLGSTFEDATLHDVSIQVDLPASNLSDDRVEANFTRDETDAYPGYFGTADIYYRVSARSAYDLSWGNPETVETQSLPGNRYITVEHASGVGSTDFQDIEDSKWTDKTDSYGAEGENVSVASISSGDENVIHYELKLQEDRFKRFQRSGAPGSFEGQQEGPLSMLFSLPGLAVSSLLALLGIKKRRSGS